MPCTALSNMLTSKLFLVVVSIVATVLAYRYATGKYQTKEPFWMNPARQVRVERVMAPNRAAAERGEFRSVPFDYTGLGLCGEAGQKRAPRKQAASSFGAMARDDYGDAAAASPPVGGDDKPSTGHREEYPDVMDMMPINDMTQPGVDKAGEESVPVVYDQHIYANRNSRLRAQGDPIRGDLPIVPMGGDWFRPSARPNVDLHRGAMNVLAGENNETTRAMTEMIHATSGGADTAVAGHDTAEYMGNQYKTNLDVASGDVHVSAYP